jgi:hypothetical protein
VIRPERQVAALPLAHRVAAHAQTPRQARLPIVASTLVDQSWKISCPSRDGTGQPSVIHCEEDWLQVAGARSEMASGGA